MSVHTLLKYGDINMDAENGFVQDVYMVLLKAGANILTIGIASM